MDARRLGMGLGLPLPFLEAAAPGYLTDTEWDALDEDWLERALAYTAAPVKGVRGPLIRIRPRPARSRAAGPGSQDSDGQLGDGQASLAGVPLYRLADYLDQYGRQHRNGQFPPESFWAAAAGYALPGDQAALGDAARNLGLYQAAAQLYKNAAAQGDTLAALRLVEFLNDLNPTDQAPARWATAHAALDDPRAVASLLDALQQAGAAEQVSALLARDPAAHAALDDPRAVASLLDALQQAGAAEQVSALLARDPAAHAAIDDPRAVASLREERARERAEVPVDRLPRSSMSEFSNVQEGHQEQFRYGREADGRPAVPWGWEDLT
jgi:uncharacterized protein YidB (DUF937 family)